MKVGFFIIYSVYKVVVISNTAVLSIVFSYFHKRLLVIIVLGYFLFIDVGSLYCSDIGKAFFVEISF